MSDKAIRAAKLTASGVLEKARAKTAVTRAGGQIAPSKYLPDVPRQVHADGGRSGYDYGGYVPQGFVKPRKLAVARVVQPTQEQRTSPLESLAQIAKIAMEKPDEAAPMGTPSADHGGMSEAALAAWGRLTNAYGQPLTVISAYRDPKRNESVGGAGNSQHMHGNAYDIDTSSMSHEDRLALADMAWDAGFRGVGFYDNSLHFDVGDPRSWGPSHSRDSIPDWARGWTQRRYGYNRGGPVMTEKELIDQMPAPENGAERLQGALDDVSRAGTIGSRLGKLTGIPIVGSLIGRNLAEQAAMSKYADGGEVTNLGQAREAKQLQTYHTGMMDDIHQRMSNAMEAHEKAVGQGVFDGYEVGDTLQGSAHPMRITGRYMQKWKPTTMALRSFERMGTEPTIIEHEGEQYIPMLRYETGKEGVDGFQAGSAYLDGVKAAGYQKMGGLRAVKARGGAVEFMRDNHPLVPDELYHGNALKVVENQNYHGDGKWTSEIDQDATNRNIAAQDFREFKPSSHGNYGPGIYLTDKPEVASDFAQGIRADQKEPRPHGQVMKLHASIKQPFHDGILKDPAWKDYIKSALTQYSIPHGEDRNARDAILKALDNDTATVRDLFLRDTPQGTLVNQHGQHDIHDTIRNSGFDGIIAHRPDGSKEYVAFKPEQVKSALSARKFDPTSPDMTYADGGTVDDPVDLGTARLMRNFNQNSTGPTPAAEGVFNRIEDRYQKSKMAYDAAHADGVFDSVQIGDVYKYKPLPNSSPMEVVGHRMMPVERWGGEKPPKYVYHGHYPVVDLKGGGETKPYSVERMEDRDLYDRVKGKPRIVKEDGGSVGGMRQGFSNGGLESDNESGISNNLNGDENVKANASVAPIGAAPRPKTGELPVGGGIRGGFGLLQAPDEAPLEGLPSKVTIPMTGQVIHAGPDPRIRAVAREYMASTGMRYNPPTKYAKVDPSRSKRISDAYESMKDDASDPLTRSSYDAMIKETMAQYRAAKAAGFKAEFWNPETDEDPYHASPRLATEDIRDNHHMWVYPTSAGYGSDGPITEEQIKKNPLLQPSGETWNGVPVTVNDIFRAVHDYFGHAKEGIGFRENGEENAWRSHAAMFSPLARLAMTSETRGQNSWLNFGPFGDKNRKARTEESTFAPQKLGILPHWVHHEGAEDFMGPDERQLMLDARARHGADIEKALAITRGFTKDGKAATLILKPKGK